MSDEINVAGIEAGMSPTDLGCEMILIFPLGKIRLGGGLLEPGRGRFHPTQVMQAAQRGSQIKQGLIRGWDYRADIEQPVNAVRERYDIDRVSQVEIPPPEEPNAHVPEARKA